MRKSWPGKIMFLINIFFKIKKEDFEHQWQKGNITPWFNSINSFRLLSIRTVSITQNSFNEMVHVIKKVAFSQKDRLRVTMVC